MTATIDKPTALAVQFHFIPDELILRDQWVLWSFELRDGRWTKPPFQTNGKYADIKTASTWTTFDRVREVFEAGGCDGVGFVLTEDDSFVGIDLDDCVSDGIVRPWREDQRSNKHWSKDAPDPTDIRRKMSYCELSPSAGGLRLLVRGDTSKSTKNGDFECYSHSRYLTITGHKLNHASSDIGREIDCERLRLLFDHKQNPPVAELSTPPSNGHQLPDDAVLEKLFASRNGARARQLFHGDIGDYTSHSEGDLSLCNRLAFFCGPHGHEQIDRIFRTSKLYREKWEQRDDYRHGTIKKAIADCTDFYRPHIELVVSRPHHDKPEESGRISYKTLTAAELDAADLKIEFLVDRTLVANNNCFIIGATKTLKTSIACDLAVSLACGGFFLGHFQVLKRCRTCLMSGESGLNVLQELARRISAAANWMLRDIDGLLFSDMLPHLEDMNHIMALEKLIKDEEIEVLIIDPLYLAIDTSGKESSMFGMGPLLRPIGELCQNLGVTMVICHHAKQSLAREYRKPTFQDAAFSTGQFVAQWICLARRSEYEAGTGHHELWMRCEGRVGHSGLWALDVEEGTYAGPSTRIWDTRLRNESSVDHDESEKVKQTEDEKLEIQRQKLLAAYGRFPAGETPRQLAVHAGMNSTVFTQVNITLLDDGFVEACDVKKKCRKTLYEGFKLTTKGQLL